MPISIRRIGDGYVATVTPPHGENTTWSAAEPMTRGDLIDQLRSLGCHTTDIGDAFYAAEPEWLTRE
jgi:hypothetical protein